MLHSLEVAIRNSMHDQLSAHCATPRWYTVAPLYAYSLDKIHAAVRDAGGPTASPGKVLKPEMTPHSSAISTQSPLEETP